jgi:hypothetical protein
LLFYAFLERRNAADLVIELTDDSGQTTNVNAQDLARKGRFNGIRIKGTKHGVWTFKIRGGKKMDNQLPRNDNIEIVAYADNRELQGHSWFDDNIKGYPDVRVIKAQLNFRYPLTMMDVIAHIYDGAQRIETITLFDDGYRGNDSDAFDGTYSGILEMKSLKLTDREDSKYPRKIRVDIEYIIHKATVPAQNVHYETGIEYKAVLGDYKNLGITHFTAYSTQTTHIKPGKTPAPSIRLQDPRKPASVKPGTKGAMLVRVNYARPSDNQVRVSLGQDVHATATSVDSDTTGAGAIIKIVYKVAKTAKPGPRTLNLQFGQKRLSLQRAMYVKRRIQIIRPEFRPPTNIKPPAWLDMRMK